LGGGGGAPPTPGQRRFLNEPDRFLRLVEEARRAASAVPDAAVGIAPHSLRAVTPDTLRAVLDGHTAGPIHIHAAEQVREVEDCVRWSGQRPVAWLLDHAEIDRRWCLIHATHMTPEESRRLAGSGAVAGLCPLTEANLGDGIFGAPTYMAAQGRFGVGSDSNVEITGPGELKQLEYNQRLATLSRNLLSAREGESTGARLYSEASAGGAQALGRRIGALAPGYRADIVVLDPTHADLAALEGDRWLDAYVFVTGRRAIESVFVAGEEVVTLGRHRARERVEQRYVSVLRRLLST
jgi:formiminoglutamate deiminase